MHSGKDRLSTMRFFREFEDNIGSASGSPACAEVGEPKLSVPNLKAVVALASARGGVGKSSLAVNLAAALAVKGRKVGILDADLNAPCVATMLGMRRIQAFAAAGLIEPAAGPLGLRLIGMDLLGAAGSSFVEAPEAEDADLMNHEPAEPDESQMLRRLLAETRFGFLDLLLIDLAPGLDHFERISKLANLSGVVFVTQSSDVALRSMHPAIDLAARNATPLLGIIENMAGFYCGQCQSVRPLFPQGDALGLRREFEPSILGHLPFDPRWAESCDRGIPFIRQYADSPLARKVLALAERLELAVSAHAGTAQVSAKP